MVDMEVDLAEVPEENTTVIGELIDLLDAIRDERREISKRDKILVEQWKSLEGQLINALEAQGQDLARSEIATATITENILPNVTDWEELGRYIIENDMLHLLQRRPSTASFRELNNNRQEMPPGVELYAQKQISLRKRGK